MDANAFQSKPKHHIKSCLKIDLMIFDEFDQALWEKVCKKQHILDYSTVQRVFKFHLLSSQNSLLLFSQNNNTYFAFCFLQDYFIISIYWIMRQSTIITLISSLLVCWISHCHAQIQSENGPSVLDETDSVSANFSFK